MVTNYYNSKNNFSSPIRREPKPHTEIIEQAPPPKPVKKETDNDNTLVLGVLAVLFLTGCNDKLLLLALLFLLMN